MSTSDSNIHNTNTSKRSPYTYLACQRSNREEDQATIRRLTKRQYELEQEIEGWKIKYDHLYQLTRYQFSNLQQAKNYLLFQEKFFEIQFQLHLQPTSPLVPPPSDTVVNNGLPLPPPVPDLSPEQCKTTSSLLVFSREIEFNGIYRINGINVKSTGQLSHCSKLILWTLVVTRDLWSVLGIGWNEGRIGGFRWN